MLMGFFHPTKEATRLGLPSDLGGSCLLKWIRKFGVAEQAGVVQCF